MACIAATDIHFYFGGEGEFIELFLLYRLKSDTASLCICRLVDVAAPKMKALSSLACLAALTASAVAKTHNLEWNVTWVTANPDGLQPRPVIGINDEWPLPLLNFTKGDRVIANVRNQLGNESTSVHFHGFFQNGTNEMDGPPGLTQCAIPPNETMVYNFTVSDLARIGM
jgi:FtsP/CotA-like multicopper oxidase with cupredoxin domain